MANARKCDRCGGFFDPLNETGVMTRFSNPVFLDNMDVKRHKVRHWLFPDELNRDVDLCPGCTTDFFLFMHPAREGDTDGDSVDIFVNTMSKGDGSNG